MVSLIFLVIVIVQGLVEVVTVKALRTTVKSVKLYIGEHLLLSEPNYGLVKIANVTNFTIEGYSNTGLHYSNVPKSRIICKGYQGGLYFLDSVNLSISRISFENCGVNVTFMPDNFTVPVAVSFRTCENVYMTEVLITNTTGYGLQVDRVHGQFVIKNSVFNASKPSRYNNLAGNARFWYYSNNKSAIGTSLLIEDSNFTYGSALNHRRSDSVYKSRVPNGSGLLLLIYSPSINIKLNRITALHNSGNYGANVAFVITDFHDNTSTISISNSFIGYGQSFRGGGIMCYVRLHKNYNHQFCGNTGSLDYKEHVIVNISNVIFYGNQADVTGGAVYVHQHEESHIDCTLRKVSLSHCTFSNNTSLGRGAAVGIIKYRVHGVLPHNSPQFAVLFQNCTFFRNKCTLSNSSKGANMGSIVILQTADSVTIQDSTFMNNTGTAISLTGSNVIFNGSIIFKRNIAAYGGALKICDSSILYFALNTSVKFMENVAMFSGGAIYAEQRCREAAPPCFFQPLTKETTPDQLNRNVQMQFINNTANIAGKAIYGGSVDNCYTISQFGKTPLYYIAGNLTFQAISNFSQQQGPSAVTSDPYGVCFCTPFIDTPHCDKTPQILLKTIFPGEKFNVSLSAVGQVNGMVPSFIELKLYSKVDPKSTQVIVSPPHDLDEAQLCQTLEVLLLTPHTQIILEAVIQRANPTIESSSFVSLDIPKIHIAFKKCPWIFSGEQGSSKCDCAPLLLKHGVTCDIASRSFLRKKFWIGCHWDNSSLNDSNAELDILPCSQIAFSKSCSEEHCSQVIRNITASTMSAQCNEGRDGTLCSVCKDGYSLSLGTSRCIKNEFCSDLRLILLLIFFLIAGALLVILLALMNLTVTEGTITGLIFYANIVHMNCKHLFPGDSGRSNANLLRIFIAWLNLDFGFEICFYLGMNAYHRVWLEFAFLIYLLLLGVVIIVTSRRYITVTRLIGRNVINVLSTVIVFSYVKLIRISLEALQFIKLKISNKSTLLLWRSMSSLEYFKGEHIPLVIVAIIMCIMCLLYNISLLFIQCLQRRSNWCFLRWVNKLRPFFDSNIGPCRDTYRFWPGLLLAIRFALLCIFSVEATPKHRFNIVLASSVLMFVLACVTPYGVYKKRFLNLLEFSFILNLGLLSGLVLSFQTFVLSFTYCSTGISALTFVCILVVHGYKRISDTRPWKKIVKYIRENRQRQHSCSTVEFASEGECQYCSSVSGENTSNGIECSILHHQPMPPVVRFDGLREPLLAED